jgi:1-deoxy-D-xylulose-5-phosphate synthase
VPSIRDIEAVPYGTWEMLRKGSDLAILAVGTMVLPAMEAAERLAHDGIEAAVVNCRYLKPYDRAMFEHVVGHHTAILTVEEGTVVNGFGSFMSREIDQFDAENRVRVQALGIPDQFVQHGPRKELLAEIGLDADGIRAVAKGMAKRIQVEGTSRESA